MPDIDEALRYLGATGADEALRRRTEAEALAVEERFPPRCAYRVFPVEKREGGVWLAGAELLLPGKLAEKMLAQCHHAAVLVCTLGLAFEQYVRGLQARDMSRAVLADACGSALVEAGCDAAEREIAARFPGKYLTDRFSPGYGDLPLEVQPAVCRVTDSARILGVHVSPSMLMTPQKSVTAIIGVADEPQKARIRGCAYCAMKATCALRKGGHSCDD